jgi:hypothetical protein
MMCNLYVISENKSEVEHIKDISAIVDMLRSNKYVNNDVFTVTGLNNNNLELRKKLLQAGGQSSANSCSVIVTEQMKYSYYSDRFNTFKKAVAEMTLKQFASNEFDEVVELLKGEVSDLIYVPESSELLNVDEWLRGTIPGREYYMLQILQDVKSQEDWNGTCLQS